MADVSDLVRDHGLQLARGQRASQARGNSDGRVCRPEASGESIELVSRNFEDVRRCVESGPVGDVRRECNQAGVGWCASHFDGDTLTTATEPELDVHEESRSCDGRSRSGRQRDAHDSRAGITGNRHNLCSSNCHRGEAAVGESWHEEGSSRSPCWLIHHGDEWVLAEGW